MCYFKLTIYLLIYNVFGDARISERRVRQPTSDPVRTSEFSTKFEGKKLKQFSIKKALRFNHTLTIFFCVAKYI